MNSREENPTVGIVVVNWNGKDILRTCLESFVEKTHYEHADILVFDNDSSDGSKAIVQDDFPEVKLIANDRNIGFVGGENEAFLRTDYDMYFFLNNDTKALTEGWLEPLVETAISDDNIGIVGPKVVMSEGIHGGGHFGPFGGYREVADDRNAFTEKKDVDWVSGAQVLVKREVLEDIGLVDEIYWPAFMEEVDLCYRARRGGYRVVYDPRSEIRHFQNETVENDFEKFHVQRRHEIYYRWVNYPLTWLLIWQSVVAPRNAAGTVLELDGKSIHLRDYALERLKMLILAYWWNIVRIRKVLEGREERKKSYSGQTDLDYWTKYRTYGDS